MYIKLSSITASYIVVILFSSFIWILVARLILRHCYDDIGSTVPMLLVSYCIMYVDVDTREYLESWRKSLEERGMRVSRPKTQFMDSSFEQNAQGN